MTPAEELAKAADKLNGLIGDATDGPWFQAPEIDGVFHGRMTVVRPEHGKRIVSVGQTRPHYGAEAEANVAYIAAMNPIVGKALVDWLCTEAQRYAKHPPRAQGFLAGDLNEPEIELDYCIRIARSINGGAS